MFKLSKTLFLISVFLLSISVQAGDISKIDVCENVVHDNTQKQQAMCRYKKAALSHAEGRIFDKNRRSIQRHVMEKGIADATRRNALAYDADQLRVIRILAICEAEKNCHHMKNWSKEKFVPVVVDMKLKTNKFENFVVNPSYMEGIDEMPNNNAIVKKAKKPTSKLVAGL